ncbi:hypothetical protein D0962_21840 [Leptolyngbyaceae cyanobacterium CCMR0082]|uniref:Uncharacterized protein n=2 Tax=Adonisia turfae TaxID=2950184 RepID=A0A6M0SAB1_9CYAN|nr:hypothetical protein [Adonisia turfae]NEZ55237.1 hypothetical protein [Adonisia turfae CCMR0081]NEZ65380.1 hypothetical protein [Adonisia turfae CCMR0082]
MSSTETINIKNLKAFLRKNKKIDFRTADLLHASTLDTYKWTGLEDNKEGLIRQLKAYQRLLRVVPNGQEDLAIKLLQSGFQSALQIANTPRKMFIQDNLKTFGNDRVLAQSVYKRAVAVRKVVALQYTDRAQQTGAHSRVAGLAR